MPPLQRPLPRWRNSALLRVLRLGSLVLLQASVPAVLPPGLGAGGPPLSGLSAGPVAGLPPRGGADAPPREFMQVVRLVSMVTQIA